MCQWEAKARCIQSERVLGSLCWIGLLQAKAGESSGHHISVTWLRSQCGWLREGGGIWESDPEAKSWAYSVSLAPWQVGQPGFICPHVTHMKSQSLLCNIVTKKVKPYIWMTQGSIGIPTGWHFIGYVIGLLNECLHYETLGGTILDENIFNFIFNIIINVII